MNTKQHSEDTGLILVMIAIVAILFFIPMIYKNNISTFNNFFMNLAEIELRPFAPFSKEALEAYNKVARVDPSSLTWDQVSQALAYCGTWWRWVISIICIIFAFTAYFMSPVDRLCRKFGLQTLLRHNVELFPCLYPVVGRGKYLLSEESRDQGPWRIARTPLQFAVENNLLLSSDNKTKICVHDVLADGLAIESSPFFGKCRLDHKATRKIFINQLGDKLNINILSKERFALAVIFIAYAAGDKRKAVDLLDAISLSYKASDNNSLPSVVVPLDTAQTLFDKHQDDILNRPLPAMHNAYILPWFAALLTLARKKGILACSQMLWVRPIDRPLWYTLTQTGGRTAFVEAYAPWAHYLAEEKYKEALMTPHIDGVVEALEKNLSNQGWIEENTHG
jgi:hypothetical protein